VLQQLYSGVVVKSDWFGFSLAGCNYVLHSSGQLFSHKRKHERRFWEYGASNKEPKLVASIATSSEATASGSDDVVVVPNPSISTVTTSEQGVQPSLTQSTVTTHEPVDTTMLCATTVALPDESTSFQLSDSNLTAVSQPNVSQPDAPPVSQSTPINVPASDPVASPSTAAVASCTDEISESTKHEAAVPSNPVETARPEMDTRNVNVSAISESPEAITVDDDDAPATTRSSPAHVLLPIAVNFVQHSFSLGPSTEMPAHLDVDMKLEKLEKKEYVDMEDLAKITKFKRIVDVQKTGTESQQSPTTIAAFPSVSEPPLIHDVTPASSMSAESAASVSALSSMSSKLLTTTKCPRSGNERKERDESWQNYIKRSAVRFTYLYTDKLTDKST